MTDEWRQVRVDKKRLEEMKETARKLGLSGAAELLRRLWDQHGQKLS